MRGARCRRPRGPAARAPHAASAAPCCYPRHNSLCGVGDAADDPGLLHDVAAGVVDEAGGPALVGDPGEPPQAVHAGRRVVVGVGDVFGRGRRIAARRHSVQRVVLESNNLSGYQPRCGSGVDMVTHRSNDTAWEVDPGAGCLTLAGGNRANRLILGFCPFKTSPRSIKPPTTIEKEFERLSCFDAKPFSFEPELTPNDFDLLIRKPCFWAQPDWPAPQKVVRDD